VASLAPSVVGMTDDPARLYVCTDSRRDRGDFEQFVDAAFAGGVDIIQLRDKTIDVAEELELLAVLAAIADRHGRRWAVNDRADIAAIVRAPLLHLGQDDLPLADARGIVGDATAIGLSTHTPAQVDAAMAARVGYFCVGPLWPTPTKPGRAAVGLELVRYANERTRETGSTAPWFAIGGIDLSNIDRVVDAGASRVVVVRAVTESTDPTDAAQRLLARLPPLL
jgi:thiamine-phosphate pyrophosphorylase